MAFCTWGNVSGIRNVNTSATSHNPASTAPVLSPSDARLLVAQAAKAADDRHRDVRQHRHLQQLDEAVGRPLQRGRALAEEQADEHASREAHENAVRK